MHLGFTQLTLLTAAWLNSYEKSPNSFLPGLSQVMLMSYEFFIPEGGSPGQ